MGHKALHAMSSSISMTSAAAPAPPGIGCCDCDRVVRSSRPLLPLQLAPPHSHASVAACGSSAIASRSHSSRSMSRHLLSAVQPATCSLQGWMGRAPRDRYRSGEPVTAVNGVREGRRRCTAHVRTYGGAQTASLTQHTRPAQHTARTVHMAHTAHMARKAHMACTAHTALQHTWPAPGTCGSSRRTP